MNNSNKIRKTNTPCNVNLDLQRWLLAHLGFIEYENLETGVKGAVNLWQISKLVPDDIVSQINSEALLWNILEMKRKGWLIELRDSVYISVLKGDEDDRRFSMTTEGMLQFRKEILPVAKMLVNQEQKLEQKIESSIANTEAKRGLIQGLKGFGVKFKDGLESEAIDFIIKTAKDVGVKSTIPILINLMK